MTDALFSVREKRSISGRDYREANNFVRVIALACTWLACFAIQFLSANPFSANLARIFLFDPVITSDSSSNFSRSDRFHTRVRTYVIICISYFAYRALRKTRATRRKIANQRGAADRSNSEKGNFRINRERFVICVTRPCKTLRVALLASECQCG